MSKLTKFLIGAAVVLLVIVLLQRNTITGKAAKLEAAEQRVGELNKANASQLATIESLGSRRVDNDAIANAVASRIGSNTVRETETRTIIEKAVQNDATVRAWADVPVPNSVRSALRAGTDRDAAR